MVHQMQNDPAYSDWFGNECGIIFCLLNIMVEKVSFGVTFLKIVKQIQDILKEISGLVIVRQIFQLFSCINFIIFTLEVHICLHKCANRFVPKYTSFMQQIQWILSFIKNQIILLESMQVMAQTSLFGDCNIQGCKYWITGSYQMSFLIGQRDIGRHIRDVNHYRAFILYRLTLQNNISGDVSFVSAIFRTMATSCSRK